MASGNYRNQPTESPPQPSAQTSSPPKRRATLKIADPSSPLPTPRKTTPAEPETRIEGTAKSRRAAPSKKSVALREPEIAGTARSRRAAPAKKSVALREPEFEQAPPPRQPREEIHPLTRHRSWLPRLLLTVICVVIGALVLTIAGIYVRQPSSSMVNYSQQGQSFPIQLGGSYQAFNTWNNSTGPIPTETPLPKNPGPYSVLGKPTISVKLINEVLASYHSPTAGMGQSLYDLGVKYGIDPVYPLAFFMHESLFGTTGEARVTLSLGNERCIPDRACIDKDRGGYAQMNSWQDGFEQWYKLIRNLYIAQWGLVTVDQIIPRYAPNSDGNNEKEYIASLKHEIDVWRAGGIRP